MKTAKLLLYSVLVGSLIFTSCKKDEEEKIDELLKMLQSICVETQAYGVSGFEMLDYNDYPIAFYARKIIKRIKKRNSETLVCNGCLTGLVMKIYTNK